VVTPISPNLLPDTIVVSFLFSIPNEWKTVKSLLWIKRDVQTPEGGWIYNSAIGIRPHEDQKLIEWSALPSKPISTAIAGQIKCYKGWRYPNSKIEEPTYSVLIKKLA